MPLSFKGHTVVVTGAGGGLGRAHALAYAARGANVVVNDVSKEAAEKVVAEITKAGGKAVINTSSVADGAAVIQTALDAFGTVTILINNAGILRDKSMKNMTDQEWDIIQLVHLKGAYACTRAAWPIFRKQKFGRVINTASASGLYGSVGQANYSAAKMGLIAFTKTLAKEGAKYNIKATAIAPVAASPMTATVLPPDMLKALGPEYVSPLVLALTHPDGPDATGRIFEIGGGYVAEIRWERTKGVVFRTDDTFTPSAVKAKWEQITDFEGAEHPTAPADFRTLLEKAANLPPNEAAKPEVRHDGKTVIITGAGAGLGRAYAHMFARLGANVVVNDVSEKGAKTVVEEITQAGGKAVAAVASAEDGDAIVKTALDAFGSVHIMIANAGILRDKAFANMTEKEWDDVIAVHLRGTYKCVKACWPIFQKQKYGRIVTTCSLVGIYGNFGQANYSTAKAAILGFTRAVSHEGKRYNILANVIAPNAGTAMTATVWPPELVEKVKPAFVAPVVGYLASEDNAETTGALFEVGAGYCAQTRWQRAGGHGFRHDQELTPEAIINKWNVFTNFDDGRATHPTTSAEALQQIVENFNNEGASQEDDGESFADAEDTKEVAEAKKNPPEPVEVEWAEKDVILYNLGIGATEQELQWTYEGSDNFQALPTYGVIPPFAAGASISFDFLPNFNPAKLLHGEQYLKLHGPIPTSASTLTQARLVEVLDKGKAAAVTIQVDTKDKSSGKVLFENQMTTFIRGSGGFGGKKSGKDRGAATAANEPPKRKPDAVVTEKTLPQQAALYRLSGDLNPLHILPEFAAVGGFDKPILHGLCSFGISGKHIVKTFGDIGDIKVRFAGVVYPGETLVTEMWKEGNKVIFVTKVAERNTTVLSAAAATLVASDAKAKL
ncbi:multifunctional beta-oxidation protein [Auricularia subglabra TFB-10046 SS5]|nr:multifunctional beta-oxidation protein [Auricularia subglabra TFB-10046 SS5]